MENLPDSHLQSAIRIDERKLFLNPLPSKNTPDYIQLQRAKCPVQDNFNINSEVLYGIIFSSVYTPLINLSQWASNEYNQASDCAFRILYAVLSKIISIINWTLSHHTDHHRRLLSIATFWEDIRMQMQQIKVKGAKFVTTTRNPYWIYYKKENSIFTDMWMSGSYFIGRRDGTNYIFDYTQMMMISDTIWARVNTLIFADMLPPEAPNKVDQDDIIHCYKIFDDSFPEHGNATYSGIKYWESILFGKIIQLYDPFKSSLDFYNNMIRDGLTDGFTYLSELQTFLNSKHWMKEQLSELYGLYRHWGHPTVDEIAGCKKIKDIIRNRPVPHEKTLRQILGATIRQFCASFISLEGRWPLITNLTTITNQILKRMAEGHTRHMNLFQDNITLEDWAELELGHELTFDYHPDFTTLLEDKSIAPLRSEFRGVYNNRILGYITKKLSQSRRLLKAVMDTTILDIKSIFQKVSDRCIPFDWKIIMLHAKERELKLKPRMFSLLPMPIRLYFSITERNIKDALFKFFPQQTMTMSESDLTKRLMGFSKINPIGNYISVFIMIDFKAWNTHWTKQSTDEFFRLIDRLFGLLEIYTFTHEFFASCLIALSSYFNPPDGVRGTNNKTGDPEEGDTLWYHHWGGFDGIRQKGWTLITIGILLLVEHITGIKAQKIGQADNQVCRLYIPKLDPTLSDEDYIKKYSDHINEQSSLFMSVLKSVASKLGLEVKDEESAISTNCMVYGKEIIVNGSYLPQTYKKISRALPDVNEQYPSIGAKISSLQSACLSAACKGYDMLSSCYYAYILIQMQFAQAIKFSYLKMSRIPETLTLWYNSVDGHMFLLLAMADLGSVPIQNCLDYLYRGHPDPLTTYTTYLYYAAQSIPIARKLYVYLQNRKYKVGESNPELLISNPCSTNIKTPPLLSSKFRNALEHAVINSTKNIMLKELFPKNTKDIDTELYKFLMSHRPIHPRFLHELYRLTPTSTRLTFLAKFSNTRTAKQILIRKQPSYWDIEMEEDNDDLWGTPPPDILDIDNTDIQQLKHIEELYREVQQISVTGVTLLCPTLLAQDMRNHSWAGLTHGASIDGVTVPHPAHQFSFNHVDDDRHSQCHGDREFITYIPTIHDHNLLLTSRGAYPPMVGSRTREKVAGRILSVPSTSRPYKAAERAITLSTWCVDHSSSLMQFMEQLALSRTNVPLDILKQTSGYISGGSMPHRLDDHVTKHSTANNFLLNITTHLLISTDNMGRFSRGMDNYVMHFQGAIHYGMSLINLLCSLRNEISLAYHLHYQGICCEELIPDIQISGHSILPTVHSYIDNPLLYTSFEQLNTEYANIYRGFEIQNTTPPSWALAHILLGRLKKLVYSLSLGSTEKSEYRTGMIGVQEIYRIGLPRIIKDLAFLIVLHIDSSEDDISTFCSVLPYEMWDDIATIIMLPEILPYVIRYLEVDGIPDAFSRTHVINRALNMKLMQEAAQFIREKHNINWTKHPPFHITPTIKVNMVLRMWARSIYLKFKKDKIYDIRALVEKALKIYYQSHQGSPNITPRSLSTIIDYEIIKNKPYQVYHDICVINRLKLAYCAPEGMLRMQNPYTFTLDMLVPCMRIRPAKDTLDGNYPLQLTYPSRSISHHIRTIDIHAPPNQDRDKTRKDQMHRLVGVVSTAYIKYLEIIIRENWELNGTAICLADGESSVGRMLSLLTSNPIIYNSLIDKTKLPVQRGHRYIPGAFLDAPDLVLGGELAVMTGGDLTEAKTVDKLLDLINTRSEEGFPPCIMTCDAECSTYFTPKEMLLILKSFLRIGLYTKVPHAILKYFALSPQVTACVGGALKTIWDSVRLVTVTFSSYENTESFWVCSSYNPSITQEILEGLPTYDLYIPNSAVSFLDSIQTYHQERGAWNQPLQSLYPRTTLDLNKLGIQLGYTVNIPHAFYIICNKNLTFIPSVTVVANLEIACKLLNKMCNKLALGLQYMYEGIPLNHMLSGIVSYEESSHKSIERYAVALFNIQLIYDLLPNITKPQKELAIIIGTLLTRHIYLRDKQNKIYYNYYVIDTKSWKSTYLKHIWRIVGGISSEVKS